MGKRRLIIGILSMGFYSLMQLVQRRHATRALQAQGCAILHRPRFGVRDLVPADVAGDLRSELVVRVSPLKLLRVRGWYIRQDQQASKKDGFHVVPPFPFVPRASAG